jgi:histidinol phosphatase-like enzyme (inositol monophosphatase family)
MYCRNRLLFKQIMPFCKAIRPKPRQIPPEWTPPMTSPQTLEAFFAELAEASGRAILPWFRTGTRTDNKAEGGAFDPVTEGDRAAERAIRDLIAARFPDHAIRGEEYGRANAGAEHEWIIDPIDGTRGFICGLPTWGTLVGLMRGTQAVYGMMNQPHVRERFTGDGSTAHIHSAEGVTRLQSRRGRALGQALLATTSPAIITGADGEAYRRLESRCRLARYGTDCYAYAMLAAGQIDLVCETGLKSYDIMPLIPIIEGAGGVVTTWDGGPAHEGGRILAAGSSELHAEAMAALQS